MDKVDILYKKILLSFLFGVLITFAFWKFERGDTVSYKDVAGVLLYYFSNVCMIYFGVKVAIFLPERVPFVPLIAAILLMASAAMADMAATVMCSPNLDREGNKVLLMLLSAEFSLPTIYTLTIIMNIIESAVAITLFAGFLKLYSVWCEAIPYENVKVTGKWLLGAGELKGGKTVLFSSKTNLSYLMSSIAFVWVLQSVYRFYMALMWFEKVLDSYMVVPTLILCASTFILLLMTHYNVKHIYKRKTKIVLQPYSVA